MIALLYRLVIYRIQSLSADSIPANGVSAHSSIAPAAPRPSTNRKAMEKLQAWAPEGDGQSHLLCDLGSMDRGGPWNQFEANRQLFQVQSTYEEDMSELLGCCTFFPFVLAA